jgi:AraC-like DNA-binding protein/TolA-binding protein
MSFKTQPFVCLIIIFYSFLGCSQRDTIAEKKFEEIKALYNKASRENNFAAMVLHGNAYVLNAKKFKDDEKLVVGYRILSVTHKDERVLQYSDSIIRLTKENSNEHYPAVAYELKGDYYNNKRDFKRSLNNYLKFFHFAKKYNNKAMISRSSYNIGTLKRRTGNLDEALEIYRANFSFTKENEKLIKHDITYLNSITALASIFNDKKNVDSATYYNKYGIIQAVRLKNEPYFNHFAVNQGITLVNKQDYVTAIDSLEKYIPYYENHKDQRDLPFAYYYAGEAYLGKNNEEKAIEYFKKVDAYFEKTQSLFPIMREAYIRLDNYYEKKDDYKNQLKYLKNRTKVDSILKVDEIYLAEGIVKKYDIPKLISENEVVLKEKNMNEKSLKNTIAILSILTLVFVVGFGIQYRKRKIYRKHFDSIINNDESVKNVPEENNHHETNKKINIPEEIIEGILKGLEAFEKKNQFISNEITLNSLAKKLQTNPSYLSKVVNHYKENSFSTYLSNLRIDYAINQLKENLVFRKYTVKAISFEVGFNNVQSFTKAFQNSKGINPSYFIKELKKIDN